MSQLNPNLEEALGLRSTKASLYFTSPDQLASHPELAAVAFAVRHAWTALDLGGVLFIDNQPTAYLKEWNRPVPSDEKEKWMKFMWNQGTAPLFILVEPNQIGVYSSMVRPPNDDSKWAKSFFVEQWEITAEALEQQKLSKYLRRVETGQIYRDHREKFDSENGVDRCLMENLHALRDRLNFKDTKSVHNLLGRILFISFLCDREFLEAEHFPGKAKNITEFFKENRDGGDTAVELLYDTLFTNLQREFNGSLFSPDMSKEREELTGKQFAVICDFLQGDEISTGQITLSFEVYDFCHIPVETISAIYEDFLEAEDADKKHKLGAYYTPRHLAEFVVNLAIQDGENVGSWKFFDPSCGSGIFLVIAFNLLAEHWQHHDEANSELDKTTRINALLKILLTQIRGVDVNGTACRIAAFSLYLALFEKVRPVELKEFKKSLNGDPILPNLLMPNDASADGMAVLTECDFTKKWEDFPKDFNCVIGNPPWKGRGQKQVAFPFVRDVIKLVKDGQNACLVLPTTMLLSKLGTLTREWFAEHSVDVVVNLADYQNQLFVGPKLPCFVMRYRAGTPRHDHSIRYLTPRVTNYENRRGLVPIESGDEKAIAQSEIVACEENEDFRLLWVSRFQASPRDLKFLQRLWMMPKLGDVTGKVNENKRFVMGVGFKPYFPGKTKGAYRKLPNNWLDDVYLPSSNKFDLLISKSDCGNLTVQEFLESHTNRSKNLSASTKLLHCKPDEELFEPPFLIHNEGFSKFAFCEQKLKFQHALHVIKDRQKDKRLIALITAFFSSQLAEYLLFYSAAGWSAGRDRITIDDKLHLPFPLPGSFYVSADSEEIVGKIISEFDSLERAKKKAGVFLDSQEIESTKARLNELILDYYQVGENERILIEETCNILKPSVRPGIDSRGGNKHRVKDTPATKRPDKKEISLYQSTLCQTLNAFTSKFGAKNKAIEQGTIVRESSRLRLVTFRLIDRGAKKKRAITLDDSPSDEDLFDAVLRRMEDALTEENAPFQYLRGFTFLDGDFIRILKPNILRQWSRTAALNDADEIIAHEANSQRLAKK